MERDHRDTVLPVWSPSRTDNYRRVDVALCANPRHNANTEGAHIAQLDPTVGDLELLNVGSREVDIVAMASEPQTGTEVSVRKRVRSRKKTNEDETNLRSASVMFGATSEDSFALGVSYPPTLRSNP